MSRLNIIQQEVGLRTQEIIARDEDWPCRKGCDECCRSLASMPRITQEEWQLIARALNSLPVETAESIRERIRASAGMSRPVVCPLLDSSSGSCLVYESRPVACRAYGFYVERQSVLGCSRIESIAQKSQDVVWGNHTALEDKLHALGPAATLDGWLASGESQG